eukprot:CAMPEP_0178713736 /NCGR_PEP_ID=MMETSP0699-20121125/19606_1 /TAXON_ID=265572 /ORGANISM="Extubocellulus spinifer, Strain CCMP396" /LENGTH=46 /DNA_ID= /DNA_START= /DNA_END= /DNA_ORIENTATION=
MGSLANGCRLGGDSGRRAYSDDFSPSINLDASDTGIISKVEINLMD